jgi:preprotein translocase subunit SecF
MSLIPEGTVIDFLGKRKITYVFSAILILIGIISIFGHEGLNYGIDFRGGTNVQLRFAEDPSLDRLREVFATEGQGNVQLQTFGDPTEREVLLILPVDSALGKGEQLTKSIQELLGTEYPGMEVRRIETIGPKVGDELKYDALYSIAVALGLVLVYITIRFQWRQGVAAIITLTHDVLVVVGLFSLFDKEFTLSVVAALLTVVGYSLNDTIVVFDRIRENQGRFRKKPLIDLMNLSITETLSRTILTSGTTLLVVIVLFVFGGEIIHDFSYALLVGIVVGTYSSIYVASPMVMGLSKLEDTNASPPAQQKPNAA